MFTKRVALISILLVAMSALAVPARAEAYRVACKIYRIMADTSGNSDLNVNAGLRDDAGNRIYKAEHFSSVFNEADFKIGGMKFHLDKNGETWDGKPEPDNRLQAVLISSPRIAMPAGEPAAIAIGSEEKMHYMKPRADGAFELTSTTLQTGMKIDVLLKDPDRPDGNIIFDKFAISMTAITGREKVDGVQLDIGKPITKATTSQTKMDLPLGRPFGMHWFSDGDGTFLIIIRVDKK